MQSTTTSPLPVEKEKKHLSLPLTPEENVMVEEWWQMAHDTATFFYRRMGITVINGLPFTIEDVLSEVKVILIRAVRQYRKTYGKAFRSFLYDKIYFGIIDLRRNLQGRDYQGRKVGRPQFYLTSFIGAGKNFSQGPSGVDLSIANTALHVHANRRGKVLPEFEANDGFEAIIRCLPKREQEIYRMYYLEDKTMKEIASRVGLSESRISQTMTAMNEYLREVLSNAEN